MVVQFQMWMSSAYFVIADVSAIIDGEACDISSSTSIAVSPCGSIYYNNRFLLFINSFFVMNFDSCYLGLVKFRIFLDTGEQQILIFNANQAFIIYW